MWFFSFPEAAVNLQTYRLLFPFLSNLRWSEAYSLWKEPLSSLRSYLLTTLGGRGNRP